MPFGDEAWGIDLEAEVAVITDDVPMGTDAATQAATHVRLRHAGQRRGRCAISSRPSSPRASASIKASRRRAFSPVAVTPDELGDAWRDSKVHLPLRELHQRPPISAARSPAPT